MQKASTNNDDLDLTTLTDLEHTFGVVLHHNESLSSDLTQEFLDSGYELLLMVGEGAMGQIFLAKDEDLLRKVAYKRLHEKVSMNPEVLTRFLREAQITAQLEHPNIVPVYNLEKTNAGWAYAMKLVFGKTFKELIIEARQAYDQNKEPEEEHQLSTMLEYFLKVCEALDFSHQKSVLHRDLKPANIMIGRYREVYVMDWGIARLMGSSPELADEQNIELSAPDIDSNGFDETQSGQILGTPRYLSPEQAAGKNDSLDGRSDLLTLGLILYELCCLKPAYHAKNITSLLKKVLKTELAPIEAYHRLRPVPRELRAIIKKATERRKENRYQSVSEMASDIRRFMRGQSILAEPDKPIQSLFRWMKQHQTVTAGTILTLLVILTSLSIGTLLNQRNLFLTLKHQEAQLNLLQTSVSRQAQLINNELLGYKALLERFEAITSGSFHTYKKNHSYYLNQDFATQNEPPDYQYYATYAKMLSLNWPVWNLPAGQSKPQNEDLSLNIINPELKHIFADSIKGSQDIREKSLSHILKNHRLPLVWAHIALENGTYLVYPGQTGFPEKYHPHNQIWYQQALKQNASIWAPPHSDILGQGLLLSIAKPIRNKHNRKVGVVNLDLSFQYLIDHLLNLPLKGGLQQYILNQEGKVIIKSSDRNRLYGMRFGSGETGKALDTPLFDNLNVVEDIQAGKSGYRRYKQNGRQILLAFYQLNSLNWFYAVEVDEKVFLRGT